MNHCQSNFCCNCNSTNGAVNTYKITLPDTLSYFLPQHKHKLTTVRGYSLFSPDGVKTECLFTLYGDKSIRLEANSSLLGYILILY